MPNRGYAESDGRFDMGGGAHDTEDRKQNTNEVLSIAGRTSVGEQIARGGWTRSDTPVGVDPDLPPDHKYQGGSADGSIRAAYPGNYG